MIVKALYRLSHQVDQLAWHIETFAYWLRDLAQNLKRRTHG